MNSIYYLLSAKNEIIFWDFNTTLKFQYSIPIMEGSDNGNLDNSGCTVHLSAKNN